MHHYHLTWNNKGLVGCLRMGNASGLQFSAVCSFCRISQLSSYFWSMQKLVRGRKQWDESIFLFVYYFFDVFVCMWAHDLITVFYVVFWWSLFDGDSFFTNLVFAEFLEHVVWWWYFLNHHLFFSDLFLVVILSSRHFCFCWVSIFLVCGVGMAYHFGVRSLHHLLFKIALNSTLLLLIFSSCYFCFFVFWISLIFIDLRSWASIFCVKTKREKKKKSTVLTRVIRVN